MCVIQSASALQWGRARAGAEITVANRYMRLAAKLQWGRARAGAEIALLLLPLAQARNPAIATACNAFIASMLVMSCRLAINRFL